MVNNQGSLFQIKSLPAFVYDRKVELEESDLNEIVEATMLLLPTYAGSGIDVKVNLNAGGLRVMADPARMKEVLMYIIRNAREAMSQGGAMTVETSETTFPDESATMNGAGLSGSFGLCSVSDTGCGMDKETSERVFEPFFTTKYETNRGLGLPIAYRIVKQHEGSMSVESRSGKGTKINVYLPLSRVDIGSSKSISLPAASATAMTAYAAQKYQPNSL